MGRPVEIIKQPWQCIKTAPVDETRIDIMAKWWHWGSDQFYYTRFCNCHYDRGGQLHGIPDGYKPVAWMPIPEFYPQHL